MNQVANEGREMELMGARTGKLGAFPAVPPLETTSMP